MPFPSKARTAKLYSTLGYTYEQRKITSKAVDAYRHAIELDKDNLDYVRGLAQNLMNDGQTDAALEQYKVIADADPSDAQTYMRIAEIYRRNGKYDQASEALKKATAIVPDSLEVQYNIAVIDEAQGKYDDAIQILNDSADQDRAPRRAVQVSDKNNRAVFLERLGTVYREANKTAAGRSTPSARCFPWATKMPSAPTSRSSRPTATTSSGRWRRPPPMKLPRSIPTIVDCRWSPLRSRLTWAIRNRPSSA